MKLAAALGLLVLLGQDKSPQPLAIGRPAPEFALPGVDGKTWTLSDFADRKLLLVLFDTVHCPTSQNYTARVKKLHEDYRDKGVGMIVISPNHPQAVRLDELGYTDLDDSFESMKLRAKDKDFRFPFCFDGEPNKVSQAYGPRATPHAFLFDPERKLRYQGGIDDSEWEDRAKVPHLRNALDALLAGKAVPVETSKVFGCSTKWPSKQPDVREFNARIAAEEVAVEAAAPEALGEIRKNDSGQVRLIHVWSTSHASELQEHLTIYHMYRHRNFAFATVAIEGPEKKDAVLASLRGKPPAGKGTNARNGGKVRNLMVPEKDRLRAALDCGWDGRLPFTLVVSASNEVLHQQAGAIDDLEVKRAIVRNLREDRRPK
jgi:hypothetical protein